MAINRKDITEATIDDYIREQKKLGKKSIRWSTKEWKILKYLVAASSLEELGFKPFKIRHGGLFMGIKHLRTKKDE